MKSMKYTKVLGSVAAVAMFVLLFTVSPAIAQEQTTVTYDINWLNASDADETINRASTNVSTNVDTWGAWKPDGVYAGSYTPESEMSLDMMMNTWYEAVTYTNIDTGSITSCGYNTYPAWYDGQTAFGGKVILAQKVKYSAEQIMSGAAHTYVRLPIAAESFHKGAFYIFESTESSALEVSNITDIMSPTYNWTERAIYNESGSYIGNEYSDMRFTYDSFNEQTMIAQSTWDCDETSKSSNHAYKYNDRVYVPLKAPIKPDTYYTFVTVGYAKRTVESGSTNIFLTQDSISTTSYNNSQCLIAYATDNTKYEIDYDVHKPNIYLGYSTVFTQGYGDRISGHTYAFESGDEIHYRQWFGNGDETGDYISVMLPFLATDNGNITVDIQLDYYMPTYGGGSTETQTMTDVTGNDFILHSTDNTVPDDVEYVDVTVTVKSDIRVGLFLSEPTDANYNRSSYGTVTDIIGYYEYFRNGDLGDYSDTESTINTFSSFYIQTAEGQRDRLFFNLFSPVHFGDGQWTYQVPIETTDFQDMSWHTFADKVFCGAVGFAITMAGVTPVGVAASAILGGDPTALAAAGVDVMLYQNWGKLEKFAGVSGARIQDMFDRAGEALSGVGDFVSRVANVIQDSLQWVVDKIIHYGSILIEVLANLLMPLGSLIFGAIFGTVFGGNLQSTIQYVLTGNEKYKPFGTVRQTFVDWRQRRMLKRGE